MIALALVLVALGAGDHERSLAVGGATRTYIVRVPPRVSEGAPLPVVLAFHGGGGTASSFKGYAGLDALADREGFVVVYPDGSEDPGTRNDRQRRSVGGVAISLALPPLRRAPIRRALRGEER